MRAWRRGARPRRGWPSGRASFFWPPKTAEGVDKAVHKQNARELYLTPEVFGDEKSCVKAQLKLLKSFARANLCTGAQKGPPVRAPVRRPYG